MYKDKLSDVSVNNTFSGLRKKVILTNLGTKIWQEIWCQCGHGGGEAPLGGPYLPDDVCVPPCYGSNPHGPVMGCGMGGITVDGELAYPAAQHPRCVAADTCQGSC